MEYNQARAGRVWWLTLTVRPRNLRELENRAFLRVCKDLGYMPEPGQVLDYQPKTGEVRNAWDDLGRKRALVAEYKREIQLALKRLHEETGLNAAQMRHIYAFEFGETRGRLHAHMLLLENGGTRLLSKVRLRKHFHHGNIHMKLLEPEELRSKAFYLTKYITKEDLRTRQCASHFWGDPAKVFFRGQKAPAAGLEQTEQSPPDGEARASESASDTVPLGAEHAERNNGLGAARAAAIAGRDPRAPRGVVKPVDATPATFTNRSNTSTPQTACSSPPQEGGPTITRRKAGGSRGENRSPPGRAARQRQWGLTIEPAPYTDTC